MSTTDGTSAERERKDLYAGVEELDLEVSFHDWPWLSDQLIQPLFNRYALAAFVHVAAARGAGQLPVNGDAEANRTAPRCRSHHQVKIPSVKAMQEPAVGPRQDRGLSADQPFASQSPSIQSQTLGAE